MLYNNNSMILSGAVVENWDKWLQLLYDFDEYLVYFILAAMFILFCVSWYYIVFFFCSLRKEKPFPKGEKNYKFAVLVPARNEDKVIENILKSLYEQDYPKEFYDVFVIVESKDDPTVKITQKYEYQVVIRTNLNHRRTKGFALDDAYQYIRSNNLDFDCFMIFDADNVVNPNYLSLMNDVRNQGYMVGVGYRNFTNASYNWISGSSGTLFSFMNQFTSNGRSRFFKKATLTGTGYYIDRKIVDDLGEWIWDGMTEDVELTTYCYYHNISMKYYNIAQYYDEQCTSYKVMHKQHVRWVWGYFNDKKKFKKPGLDYGALPKRRRILSLIEYNCSIYPFVVYCVLGVIAFVMSIVIFICSFPLAVYYDVAWDAVPAFFGFLFVYFAFIYLTFAFVAGLTFVIDNKRLKFSVWLRIKIVFTYMFFFADFLFAFLDGLFHKKKRYSWDKIEHKGEVVDKAAKKTLKDG